MFGIFTHAVNEVRRAAWTHKKTMGSPIQISSPSFACREMGEGLVVTARAVLQLLGLLTAAALKTDYSAEEGREKIVQKADSCSPWMK